MYFHLPPHVYLTYFNNEIVALDLIQNKYIFFSEKASEIIYLCLTKEFYHLKDTYILADSTSLPSYFDNILKLLKGMNILKDNCYSPFPLKLEKDKLSSGASNVDWRMEYGELDKSVPVKITLEAYLTIFKVFGILKTFGFYHLIKLIKKKKKQDFFTKHSNDFNMLVTALNKACFYFPVRVKCLEWSAALTFMALKRKWKCNIEIGVQNLPFRAHAWVKAQDKVIADADELPKRLSIILSEPFKCF